MRCMTAARSKAVVRAQASAARFAAPIASWASARSPCGTAPIVSPVAGESASNVSPDSALVHAPSMSILLDATRALVVHDDAHQIPDRDDADGDVPVEHGQVTEAAVDHHGR